MKKSSILICKTSGIFHLEILQTQRWETDVLRCHSSRLRTECEFESFRWKRLALFDAGIGPQQNRRSDRNTIKARCFPCLGHLQAILQQFKRSLHVNWKMTFYFSIIENQKTWVNICEHDVTCNCFNCLRLLLSHSFLQFLAVAAQHADPSGMGQSSGIGSLL